MSKNLLKHFKNNLGLIVSGIVLLIIFYLFSFFMVKGHGLDRFDFDMSVRIQDNVPRRIDPYLSILSLVGSAEGVALILAVVLLIRRRIQGGFALLMFVIMHVVEIIGKAYLDHPPTPFMFHRYALDFVFPSGYVQPGGSYPSGHAMRTAFLSIILFSIINRTKFKPLIKWGIYSVILAVYFAMIVSRVSLGEHWTSDVIGGSILGAAFALFSLVLI